MADPQADKVAMRPASQVMRLARMGSQAMASRTLVSSVNRSPSRSFSTLASAFNVMLIEESVLVGFLLFCFDLVHHHYKIEIVACVSSRQGGP